jgi:surface protein
MVRGSTAVAPARRRRQFSNKWNVSNVWEMQSMFHGATSFNQPLNDWNVSYVGNMRFYVL